MSLQLELILKPKDLCGTLYQKSQLLKNKVQLLLQHIPWKKLRHFARKWGLWYKESSNASDHQHISRISMELVMKLKLKLDKFKKMKSTKLLIKIIK